LDKYFIEYFHLAPEIIVGLAFVISVMGFFLAAATVNVNRYLRRVSYVGWNAVLTFGLSTSQLLWLLIYPAADVGLLWVLVCAALGSYAFYGAGLYCIAAARSLDITRDTARAWWSIVPILNLWLMFARGRDGNSSTAKKRTAFSKYIADPLAVTASLVLILFGSFIDTSGAEVLNSNQTPGAKFNELMTHSMTLEESFEREVELGQTELPLRTDHDTVLVHISAHEKTLTQYFEVDSETRVFPENHKLTLANIFCADGMFGPDIKRGGTLNMIYNSTSGSLVASFEVTQKDCKMVSDASSAKP